MIKTWRKRLPMSPSAYSPSEVERVMQAEIDELRAALAEMTAYRDANNFELGRMTEKCNALLGTLATARKDERERCAKNWIAERGYDKYGVAEFLRNLTDE